MRPKKVILCVDDNELVLSTRTFVLETRGYRVIAVASGAEALAVVVTGGTIDLLLSDLMMPEMDGNELVKRAKLIRPSLPSMIVTGSTEVYQGCADVFLPKGTHPAEIIERCRVLCARKRGPKKAVAA